MDRQDIKNAPQRDINNDEYGDYGEDFEPLQESIKVQNKQPVQFNNNENQFASKSRQEREEELQGRKNNLYADILNESNEIAKNDQYLKLAEENRQQVRQNINPELIKNHNKIYVQKEIQKDEDKQMQNNIGKQNKIKDEGKLNDEDKDENKYENKYENENEAESKQSKTKQVIKKQEDRQSRIKDTIQRITKNIMYSKKQIVQDITSINRYYEQNERSIKDQLQQGSRLKISVIEKRNKPSNKQEQLSPIKRMSMKEEQKRVAKNDIVEKIKKMKLQEKEKKSKEVEKRKNREIFQQQKLARKQQEMILRNQSKAKKNEIERRIMYEQKFMSRRSVSPKIPISNQEIKAFQDAFIQHIKERLNIGKLKNKVKSVEKQKEEERRAAAEEQRKNYNKKINKGEKLKQKIILNLKKKIQKQLEPTYESIIADSKDIDDLQQKQQRKRSHQSAPQLRLPSVNPKPLRRTFYSKLNPGQPRVHILKLSNN